MIERRPREVLEALTTFVETPLDDLLRPLESGPEGAGAAVLELFQETASSVPAYQAFLAEHAIDPTSVDSLEAFRALPLVTRDGYLRKHSLPALTRGGRLENTDMVAVSSGSTGEPGFWPRSFTDELAIAVRFEQIFADAFGADSKRTLAVVCFALGTWVGGMFTAACCRHLATKGYPVTVVTPGNNPAEILRVVRGLAPEFDQTVLLGYPPFLKDVIDQGNRPDAQVDWAKLSLKLVTAGEVFSEEWRDLVCQRAGIAAPHLSTASLYGTADAGVLANETPLSIVARRFLSTRLGLAQSIFGEARLPTLLQYDPRSRYFECEERSLIFSGRNGVPLVRYRIGDNGGVFGYRELLDNLEGAGFDMKSAVGTMLRPPRELPFVFVFGRTHFAVSFFGANVFPETISVALEQPGIAPHVTGKFVLEAKEGLNQAPHLAIAVELAGHSSAADLDGGRIAVAVLEQLRKFNSEFTHYTPPAYQEPRISLHPLGDPEWFPAGVKHRYTRR